jgi:hypothetical protein
MPDNTAKQSRRVNWGMLLFGLPFSAFALYIGYAIQWSEQKQSDAAARFEPVLATILEAKVAQTSQRASNSGSPSRSYQPHIRYEYQFDGQTYRSTTFSYLGPASADRDDMRRIVERYPPGSRQAAYVNPDNPAEAVLHRGLESSPGALWLPALFLLVGLLCVIGGWRGWLQGKRA